jgi:hypothetical protein
MSFLDRTKDVRQGHMRWARAVNNYNKHRGDGGEKLFAARMAAANAAVDEIGFDVGPFTFWRADNALYQWDDVNNRASYAFPLDVTWKRRYYACTTFCAGLQATLDFMQTVCERPDRRSAYDARTINHIYLIDALQGEQFSTSAEKITRDHPVGPKGAKCRVCGRTIYNDGQLGGDPQVDFPPEAKAYDPAFTSSLPPTWHGLGVKFDDTVVEDRLAQMAVEDSEVFAVTADGKVIDIDAVKMVALTSRERALWLFVPDDVRAAFAKDHGMTVQEYYG